MGLPPLVHDAAFARDTKNLIEVDVCAGMAPSDEHEALYGLE